MLYYILAFDERSFGSGSDIHSLRTLLHESVLWQNSANNPAETFGGEVVKTMAGNSTDWRKAAWNSYDRAIRSGTTPKRELDALYRQDRKAAADEMIACSWSYKPEAKRH